MAGLINMATTPNYGWNVPVATDYVKDGYAAIATLGDEIDATVFGLPSAAFSLISATTIGTTVTSVNVTDAFSATYENYKIIINGGVSSADCYLGFKLGASVASYYGFMIYGNYGGSTVLGAATNNAAIWNVVGEGIASQSLFMNVDLLSPFLAKYTRFGSATAFQTATGSGVAGGVHKVATSYTDFTVIPSTGTITGGTIYVYGYNK
jgi:hypothetical protein